MSLETVYVPPAGEYVRPRGSLFLKPGMKVDNHYVRGAFFHQDALRRFHDGQNLNFELVPEPGNPWDHWAVAVHAHGTRIGYIAAADSGRWHEVVVAYNRRGQAVYAQGLVRTNEDALAATVLLPMFDDNERLMDELGLFEECRRLVDALPKDARAKIFTRGLDDDGIRMLRAHAHLAPSLNWQIGTGSFIHDDFPTALYCYLNRRDKEERAQRKAAREAAAAQRKADREAERQRKREERDGAREAFSAEVVRRFLAGESRSSIALKHGCSLGKVSLALVKAGYPSGAAPSTGPEPPKYGADARDERLERARLALELQRKGLLRREIAEKLGCSPLSVKPLLSDAKFYEDPNTNPGRLAALLRVRDLQPLSRDELARELGVSLAAVKELRRDLGIVAGLHPGLMR